MVSTEWVCFLDADDELEPEYFEKMADGSVISACHPFVMCGMEWIQGVHMPRVAGHEHVCEASCLADGNWIVIGAVARTYLVYRVGVGSEILIGQKTGTYGSDVGRLAQA